MTENNNITNEAKYKHLTRDERIIIKTLLSQGYSNRQIAKQLGRSHQTINNEIQRGICVTKRKTQGKNKEYVRYYTKYDVDYAQNKYIANRLNCTNKSKLNDCIELIKYLESKILNDKWSVDATIGYIKNHTNEFNFDNIPCTKTIYNWIDKGLLRIKNIDLPEKVSRNQKKKRCHENKKILGDSIELRPEYIDKREEFGHWEIDTVIGKKTKDDSVLLTITERKTRFDLLIKIDSKDSNSVNEVIEGIKDRLKDKMPIVFKTITADNGVEFSGLYEMLKDLVNVYFAHPYSSYERGTNERHNRIIRTFIKKGQEIKSISNDTISRIQDNINGLPRKILRYKTPEESFLEELRLITQKS